VACRHFSIKALASFLGSGASTRIDLAEADATETRPHGT
jgi:hypothetical protein